jgi:hypothetical protein
VVKLILNRANAREDRGVGGETAKILALALGALGQHDCDAAEGGE